MNAFAGIGASTNHFLFKIYLFLLSSRIDRGSSLGESPFFLDPLLLRLLMLSLLNLSASLQLGAAVRGLTKGA